jgi:hypothetical protein
MGRCIEIRRVGCCAYGVDFPHSPFAARWVYATSRMIMVPSASRRTLNGSAVVAIGVRRRGIGRDDGHRLYCAQPRSNVTRKVALKGSVKVTIDDSCEGV